MTRDERERIRQPRKVDRGLKIVLGTALLVAGAYHFSNAMSQLAYAVDLGGSLAAVARRFVVIKKK